MKNYQYHLTSYSISIMILLFLLNFSCSYASWEKIYNSNVLIESGSNVEIINEKLKIGNYLFKASQSNLDIVLKIQTESDVIKTYNNHVDRNFSEEIFFQVSKEQIIKLFIGAYSQVDASSQIQFELYKFNNLPMNSKLIDAYVFQNQSFESSDIGVHEDLNASISKVNHSIKLWSQLNIVDKVAYLQFNLGMFLYDQFKWKESAFYLERVLKFYKNNNIKIYASILNNLAASLLEMKSYNLAQKYLLEAIEIQENNKFMYDLGVSNNNLGLLSIYQSENIKAGKIFQKASLIFSNINVKHKQALSIGNYAVSELYLGHYFKSIDETQKCLSLLNDDLPQIQAAYLTNMAVAQEKIGNIQNALISLQKAKFIQEKNGDMSGMVWTLTGMADLSRSILHYNTAINNLKDALKIARVQSEHSSLLNVMLSLGSDYFELSQRENNVEYLEFSEKYYNETLLKAKSVLHKAKSFAGIAKIETVKGNRKTAIDNINKAINISNDSEISFNKDLASSFYIIKHKLFDDSLRMRIPLLEKGLDILKKTKESKTHFILHNYLAKEYNKVNQIKKARKHNLYSLDILLRIKDRTSNPWLSTDLSEWQHRIIETGLQIQQINNEKVLIERLKKVDFAKASSLREQMSEAKKGIFENLSEDELKQWNNSQANLLSALKKLDDVQQQSSNQSVTVEKSNVLKARYQKEVVRANLRISHPKLVNLIYPQSPVYGDYQKWLKKQNRSNDVKTIIINYFVGKNQSYAWMIDSESILEWNIPNKIELEQELIALNMAQTINTSKYLSKLSKLGKYLLPKEIPHNVNIVFIPDDVLNTFPFSALIVESNSKKRFLIEKNQIFISPTASLLFSGNITRKIKNSNNNKNLLIMSGNLPGYNLTSTVKEAQIINGIWEGKTRFFDQENESLESFLALDLYKYNYIHFATHGKIDREISDLAGLAFRNIKNQVEYLNLAKINQLKLSSKLVTLSACETGQGVKILGEGIIGLARGFLYAGSESVLVTLWEVPDRTTTVFMKKFYEILNLNGNHHIALRKTQLSAINGELGRELRLFKNWAGFNLIGI